jgi:hypothetical protein
MNHTGSVGKIRSTMRLYSLVKDHKFGCHKGKEILKQPEAQGKLGLGQARLASQVQNVSKHKSLRVIE